MSALDRSNGLHVKTWARVVRFRACAILRATQPFQSLNLIFLQLRMSPDFTRPAIRPGPARCVDLGAGSLGAQSEQTLHTDVFPAITID
jgi:hypothetical protein